MAHRTLSLSQLGTADSLQTAQQNELALEDLDRPEGHDAASRARCKQRALTEDRDFEFVLDSVKALGVYRQAVVANVAVVHPSGCRTRQRLSILRKTAAAPSSDELRAGHMWRYQIIQR